MLDLDTRRAVLQLTALGHGVRAIARTLQISRHSVREVLRAGSAAVPAIEREQTCAPHLDVLRGLYADCKGNRVRVWEEAQKQGIAISYPALTAFLRRQRVGVKVKQPAGQYHFAPGEEMQHDTSPHDVKVGETVRRLQCASLVLCYSRMIFARAYPVWNRFHARMFLSEAIVHLGGAAARCIIDNSSVIIAHGTGKNAVAAPEMAALAARFDFRFVAHELGDANRSARVERPFDYIERNFYPGRRFADLNDLNGQFATWCEQVNRSFRKHFGFRPSEMHAAERPLLKRLPLYIPEVYDLHQRMVDVEGFVCLHHHRYEVPPELIGRRVEVRESKDRVRIFCGPQEVAVHARLEPGVQKRSLLPERPERRRARHHQECLREEVELQAAGAEFGELLGRLHAEHGRALRHIRILHRLYLDYPTEALRKAIAHALGYGLTDLGRLEKLLLKQIAGDYFRLTPPSEDDDDDQSHG
jgi:transposase